MDEPFEPKILALLCNWCSYAGADLAGVSRLQYPPNARIVRIMCTGRVDPTIVVQSFLQGTDAVLVGGCHIGDCHYFVGNYHAENKIKLTRRIIEKCGLDPDRLKHIKISAAEGDKFATAVREFTERAKELGPSPVLKESSSDLRFRLYAALDAAHGQRLRTLVAHEYRVTKVGNVYGEKVPKERWNKLLDETIDDELGKYRVMRILKKGSTTVPDLSSALRMPSNDVFRHIVALWQDKIVEEIGHRGQNPIFKLVKAGGD